MANGRIEIHDPFSNHDVPPSRTRCGSSGPDDLQDMPEFRLMMAFARRRRTQERAKQACAEGNSTHSAETLPQTPATTREEDVKRKKKMMMMRKRSSVKKTWKTLISCFKPTIEISEATPGDSPTTRGFRGAAVPGEEEEEGKKEEEEEEEEEGRLEEAAKMLTKLADEIPFTPPEVETDSPDDDAHIERLVGLLLREYGDQINEREELREGLRATEAFWNYPFFERLIVALLRRMGLWTHPDTPGPQTSPKTQIAVTCEVASRLSAANTLPMNRLMGYGATYLQNHFSSWATQQGGYEEAFNSDDEEEDDVQ